MRILNSVAGAQPEEIDLDDDTNLLVAVINFYGATKVEFTSPWGKVVIDVLP